MKPVAPVSATLLICPSQGESLKRLLEAIRVVKQLLELRSSQGAGQRLDELLLDPLRRLVLKLCADGGEGQPAEHACRAADAEDQLLVGNLGKVLLEHPPRIALDPLEP